VNVAELHRNLEHFSVLLREHIRLWAESLDDTIPRYPIRNRSQLEDQVGELNKLLGALRPYVLRFRNSWIMHHPSTSVRWNALDTAVSLGSVAQIKGPSLRTTIEQIDQILGRLAAMNPEDDIPEDTDRPIRPGASVDYLISGYVANLHPYIYEACSRLFFDGHYVQAVEEAAKAIFQYIRNRTGLRGDGADLVNATFSTTHPILAFGDLSDDSVRNQQVGFMEMLRGIAKAVRNPLTHTQGHPEEMQKAFEYLVLASLMCRRIDDASPSTSP
jgi:uncharacterized protein (TIGR02391 family)